MTRKKVLKQVAAATLTVLTLSSSATAQARLEPSPPPREPASGTTEPYEEMQTAPQTSESNLTTPPAPIVDSDSTEYLWILNQVRQKRQQATAKLRALQQTTAKSDASGDEHRRIHQMRRSYEDQDSKLQDREQRVNRQLDRLERLLKEHEVLNQEAPTTVPHEDQAPDAATQEQTTVPDAQTNTDSSRMVTKPIAAGSDPVEPDTLQSENNPPPVETPSETTPSLSPSQVDAIALTNETVDSLALANNLYGTGEYSLALKIYSTIDQSEMVPDDKIWIRFQVANCQRRLGNFREAQRGYRVVTSAAGESWIGKTAHWWLDATDRTARLKSRIDNLQAKYDELRKEIDEPIAEP